MRSTRSPAGAQAPCVTTDFDTCLCRSGARSSGPTSARRTVIAYLIASSRTSPNTTTASATRWLSSRDKSCHCDGRALDGTAVEPPEWILDNHEALYECFTLLSSNTEPKLEQVFEYGEHILRTAVSPVADTSFPRWLRSVAATARSTVDLCDPDLLLLPHRGGRVRWIEIKGEDDQPKRDKKDESSLSFLASLGFDVELWWVLPAGKRPKPAVFPPQRPEFLRGVSMRCRGFEARSTGRRFGETLPRGCLGRTGHHRAAVSLHVFVRCSPGSRTFPR